MKVSLRHEILELAEKGVSGIDIACQLDITPADVLEVLLRFGHMNKIVSVPKTTSVRVFELKSQNLDITQIAKELCISESTVEAVINKDKSKIKNNLRAKEFLNLYRSGESLESISRKYGLTRERVRQITKKQYGYELGFGPTEQKVRKNEINDLYREIVIGSRAERHDEFINERVETARSNGIEPEYFDSLTKYAKAINVSISSLKTHRPDIYQIVQKNARQKSKRWSWYYDACRMCGTTKVKHKIYGYCMNCYYKNPEFKAIQQRSYIKSRDNRLQYNKRYGKDYYNRPEVKEKLEREYDDKYFGGNRRLALERDAYRCIGCGMSINEKNRAGKPRVRVWHLGDKNDHSLNNLGTYCESCLYSHGGVDVFHRTNRVT